MDDLDMTDSLAAKSAQLNAVDLAVPRTFTIEKVTKGSVDQPFDFHLAENPGHPYRPSKGMRRIIARGWGTKPAAYIGRRFTLWCNPEVTWAGAPVGGIQVSHMSDIGGPFVAPLRLNGKQVVQYTVQPLVEQQRPTPAAQPDPSPDEIAACTDRDTLLAWHKTASPEAQALIVARGKQLAGGPS